MVSAEKYIRRTAVRWSLMGAGMRVIEFANLEHRRNKKKLCNFDKRFNLREILFPGAVF